VIVFFPLYDASKAAKFKLTLLDLQQLTLFFFAG